ncbi:MAG: T3SS effector HopA1 family protein [Xenococcaceae cyanobacterium MO_188.B29]|nr:T3SS effector HopA1 family protein [Xenococcaceae cyanobacterium MO_188.B29]
MQVLDHSHRQMPIDTPKFLEAALTDIVNQIEFSSDFCIIHPEYQPWQLPAETVTRYQQLPSDIQNQYLRMRLCDFLYGIYFDGSLKTALAPDVDSVDMQQHLENKTYLEVDQEFYQRLHTSNHGKGYFDPGWLVLKEENDNSLAVTKNSLTLYIKRDRHLQLAEQSARVGDSVRIMFPSNQIESAYYIAIGNAGFQHLDQQAKIVSVYFNLSSNGAVAVIDSLTKELNAIALSFSFKLLYNPADYDCYDSGILYFEQRDYPTIYPLLQSIYLKHQSHFQPEVPLFTKVLAPGLALAEEPNQKFFEQDNFGRNRCQIVTNGLLVARQKGDESPQGRIAEIREQFSLMGIKLQHSYLNPKSEDIYTPLDLGTSPQIMS